MTVTPSALRTACDMLNELPDYNKDGCRVCIAAELVNGVLSEHDRQYLLVLDEHRKMREFIRQAQGRRVGAIKNEAKRLLDAIPARPTVRP